MRNLFLFVSLCMATIFIGCKKDDAAQEPQSQNQIVTAGFTFTKSGLSVQFTNTSQNADSVSWHFGDGSISDQQNPLHVYASAGNYNVQLEVFQHCKDTTHPEKEKQFCASASASKSFTLDVIQGPTSDDVKLSYMEIAEKKDSAVLYLYGKFANLNYGDDLPASAVMINGHPANRILFLTNGLIECSIGGQDAPNGRGDVYVEIKGRKSNTRKITLWKTYITYHKIDLNTLHQEAIFQIGLRADIGAHEPIAFLMNPESSCTSASFVDYSMGGEGSCPNRSTTVKLEDASGTFGWSEPYRDHANVYKYSENFQFECKFKDRHFIVTGLRATKKDATKMITSHPTSQPYTENIHFNVEVLNINESFDILLNPDGSIMGMKIAQTPHSTEYGFQCWSVNDVPYFTNSIDIHTAQPL